MLSWYNPSCFVQSINNHNKAFIENVYLPPAIELLMLQKEKFQEHTTVYQTCWILFQYLMMY